MPERPPKPREFGFTMVMDKGLSQRETEDFISVAGEYTDVVKLGFGTSFLTPNLEKKIATYQEAGIPVYFGGTLFEVFVVRGMFDEYQKVLKKLNITHVEVSDGSMEMSQEEKCRYIRALSRDFAVLSEVGSKDASKIIPSEQWVAGMQAEMDAGAWKVIAEAREGGNVGIYQGTGEVRTGLVEEILNRIPQERILWEAPLKNQQIWFLKLYGANVNLGNIAPAEVIPLETLRIGLRSDTFHDYL